MLSAIWAASSRVGARISAPQRPYALIVRRSQSEPVEQRQDEGRGLAGPGLGDREDVF